MATLTNKNEQVIAPFFKNGVTLQFFQIDFGADVSAMLDADTTNANPRSPVAVALEAIAQTCSIEVIGTVDATGGTGQGLRFAVAAIGGAYGTDTYDNTNSETLAEHLEDLVKAAGTHQGVNLASATVVAFAL
jgi:phosphoglycolate phosphatase-like HAD superfamily hydrolase